MLGFISRYKERPQIDGRLENTVLGQSVSTIRRSIH